MQVIQLLLHTALLSNYCKMRLVHLRLRKARRPSLGQILTVVIEHGETSIWKMDSAGAPTTTLAADLIAPVVRHNNNSLTWVLSCDLIKGCIYSQGNAVI